MLADIIGSIIGQGTKVRRAEGIGAKREESDLLIIHVQIDCLLLSLLVCLHFCFCLLVCLPLCLLVCILFCFSLWLYVDLSYVRRLDQAFQVSPTPLHSAT